LFVLFACLSVSSFLPAKYGLGFVLGSQPIRTRSRRKIAEI
jgi:hypothetical protein